MADNITCGFTNTDGVNLYEETDENSDILERVPMGRKLMIASSTDGYWMKVYTGFNHGYVKSSDVDLYTSRYDEATGSTIFTLVKDKEES